MCQKLCVTSGDSVGLKLEGHQTYIGIIRDLNLNSDSIVRTAVGDTKPLAEISPANTRLSAQNSSSI